jgi:MtrB/PioB family decaheme-associated outer membrane protein
MKIRAELLMCAAALAIGAGSAMSALAADVVTKAPPMPAAEPLPWWYEGFAEVGGRFFLNNPDRRDLGKFYEYRDLRPGVFGNFFFGAHRINDPLDIEIWGKNVGWTDQAFGLDVTKPGQYYLTFGWDETPHVYSQKALTLYNGVGTNNLTVPGSVSAALNGSIVGGLPTAASNAIINGNSHTIDLKVRRDTASAAARWTPTDAWDFNVDYSHMHREGVQGMGAVSFSPASSATSATRSTFELPRPIDDTTQNASLKGEYAGSTPWDKPFNVAVAGGFSSYKDSFNSLTFQNPWNPVNTALRPLNNLYSLPQDNQAGSVNVTGGVGLPLNSRYMGTFQYTKMTSDQSSLPFSINPFVLALGTAFTTPNRDTSTTLFNNVLATQITSDLKSTLRYRYFNYNTDNTQAIIFAPRPPNPDSTLSFPDEELAIRTPSDYTKQNADAEIAWRASKWLSFGASYDWEHWSRTFSAVNNTARQTNTTNENTGKVFLDSKWGFSSLRASLQYGQRRYDQYVAAIDDSNIAAYRMRDQANRDRSKGLITWAVDVTNELTITPNAGFLWDDYRTNINFFPDSELGLKSVESWNAGIDATFSMNRSWALLASYNFDRASRETFENASPPKADLTSTDLNHTFIVGTRITIIPDRLFFDANYTYTYSTSQWDLGCTPAGCQYTPLAVYPDIHNRLSRLDAQVKYVFDDSVTRSWGLFPNTKAYVKARVLWEKNSNDSWQSVQNQLGWLIFPTNATTAYSIWMANGNPNYDAVVGQVSLGLKW